MMSRRLDFDASTAADCLAMLKFVPNSIN